MTKTILQIILLIFYSTVLKCQNIDVYEFPGNTNSYLKMTKHPGKTDLDKLAVCLRFYNRKLERGETIYDDEPLNLASVLQQQPTGVRDEFFYLGLRKRIPGGSKKKKKLKVDDMGKPHGFYQMTTKGTTYVDGGDSPFNTHRWNHICASVKYMNGEAHRTIYVDGKLHFNHTTSFLPSTIWPNTRSFTFGAREYPLDGFPLNGLMTDVQIFTEELSTKDMMDYTTCQKDLKGNLASWTDSNVWTTTGSVTKTSMDKKNICSKDGSSDGILMLMPAQSTWKQAKEMCHRLNGRLHMASTQDSVQQALSFVQKSERSGKCSKVWLGATDEQEEGVWRDSETDDVIDLSSFWKQGQPNGDRIQNCLGITEGTGNNRFDDGKCEYEKRCFMCNFKQLPKARLRGICENKWMDIFYNIEYDESTSIPYFNGETGSKIQYDETNLMWLLTNEPDNGVVGNASSSLNSLGTGNLTWQFNKDICDRDSLKPFKALMSVCSKSEFTCHTSGQCISMEERCDHYPNCEDHSDEEDCHVVLPPYDYHAFYAPFRYTYDGHKLTKVPVKIKIDLLLILKIDEIHHIFRTKFDLHSSWSDHRLKLYNIKSNENMNTLTVKEKNEIWVPVLEFSNTEQKHITENDDRAFAVAEKLQDFEYSDNTYQDNKYVFKGSQNLITLNRVYDEEWICDYHMGWYPFDTQTCHMYLKPDGNSGEFIDLEVGYLKYHGEKDLQQYFIRTTAMTKINCATEKEHIHSCEDIEGSINVEVVLGRRLLGTIMTVYIPTLLLIVISYATNFFKPFFFEAIVGVNLTSMLVLATMFLSVADNLPKTSYIKMVDVWLVVTLAFPFLEVLLHTAIDHFRDDDESKGESHKEESTDGEKRPSIKNNFFGEDEKKGRSKLDSTLIHRNEEKKVQAVKDYYKEAQADEKKVKMLITIAKVALPIAFVVFASIYWTIGILKYLIG